MFRNKILGLTLASLIMATAASANAKNDKAHGKPIKKASKKEFAHQSKFSDGTRNLVSDFLRNEYGNAGKSVGKSCPPGLAKKNPLCMSPGQYKKYVVGQPLGNGIVPQDIPGTLLSMLPGAPTGTRYGMVDNDVLLLSTATRLVLDAVTIPNK